MPLNPGNSVSGGTYNAVKPTFTDGAGGDLQFDTKGHLFSVIANEDSNATATIANPGDAATNAVNALRIDARLSHFNGATWDRVRTANVFKNLSAVVISTETTIWTPAGGKKFRLMGFVLTQGVLTGAITIRDNTAGTTILTIPQSTIGVAFASPPMGNGILSAAANNVLTAQGVATETITGFVFGTEE